MHSQILLQYTSPFHQRDFTVQLNNSIEKKRPKNSISDENSETVYNLSHKETLRLIKYYHRNPSTSIQLVIKQQVMRDSHKSTGSCLSGGVAAMMLQCHRVAIVCHWSSVYIHKTNKQHCGRCRPVYFHLFIFYEKHITMGITA